MLHVLKALKLHLELALFKHILEVLLMLCLYLILNDVVEKGTSTSLEQRRPIF